MPEPMSPERLAEITACERETREGPWVLADANDGDGTPPLWVVATSEAENEDCDWAVHIHIGDKGVGEFIAMARTAVPELLAEVERLRAIVAERSGQAECDHVFATTATGEPTACACGYTYVEYDRDMGKRMAQALEAASA
jgi:hypothetical protein